MPLGAVTSMRGIPEVRQRNSAGMQPAPTGDITTFRGTRKECLNMIVIPAEAGIVGLQNQRVTASPLSRGRLVQQLLK